MSLKEVEAVRQLLTGLLMDALPNQEGQFVGILAWSRDTDGTLRGGGGGGGEGKRRDNMLQYSHSHIAQMYKTRRADNYSSTYVGELTGQL